MSTKKEGTIVSIQEVNQILGSCSEFYTQQIQRLLNLGIDVRDRAVSHLAYRTKTLAEYLEIRQQLEPFCSANVENIWGGRPISKLLLQTPLPLTPDNVTHLIELIPPPHPDIYQSVYKLRLEHVGIVIGETLAEFRKAYANVLTGQQDQNKSDPDGNTFSFRRPSFITFSDYSAVKFYQVSLQDICILEGRMFDGFYHTIE
jgi:predicted metalloenzyme YecM